MKIVNIESFPIRVSNSSDKGRKIDTKNINTAMLANNELSEKLDSYEENENKSDTKRHLEVKSMDSYETIIKDMGEYYIDDGSNTSIYSKSHETTVVKIETDTGIIGWGEAQSPVSPNTSATIVKDIVTPLTIGKNIFEKLFQFDVNNFVNSN